MLGHGRGALKKRPYFTNEYFERQRAVISKTRLSECRFYQKVTNFMLLPLITAAALN